MTVTLEWTATCAEGCGLLYAGQVADSSRLAAERHVRKAGHATHQTGVPAPADRRGPPPEKGQGAETGTDGP